MKKKIVLSQSEEDKTDYGNLTGNNKDEDVDGRIEILGLLI